MAYVAPNQNHPVKPSPGLRLPPPNRSDRVANFASKLPRHFLFVFQVVCACMAN